MCSGEVRLRRETVCPVQGRRARIRHREAILGFVRDQGTSRWLTDPAIVSGVLEAIARDTPRHAVGTVAPWEQRPQPLDQDQKGTPGVDGAPCRTRTCDLLVRSACVRPTWT
jgi:hypothetical protein